jgi:thiosulfate dehydrogenase [quinone] large subunit
VQRGIFLRAMGGAVSALALTGAVGALGRLASPMRALADAARSSTLAKTAGTYIGNIKRMKAHQALGYTDPATGDPAVLLKLGSGKIIALDAVCKHQGCTVMFDPSQDLMICPCHGSTYDPNHGAKVIAGPAPAPLDILKIKILPNWDVYALDGKGGKASKANGLHKVKTW